MWLFFVLRVKKKQQITPSLREPFLKKSQSYFKIFILKGIQKRIIMLNNQSNKYTHSSGIHSKTKGFLLIILSLFIYTSGHAQEKDSTKTIKLNEVTISGYRSEIKEVERLSPVQGTYINAGKKSEVVTVQELPANIAEKNGRQIFSKIPGVFIYDMDGSGNQVNISTRGLDPHRSWEFNIRQNGIMTNTDIYGYPASHYSPPMESIQKVELIRGTSSLQYGAEFGGMINYIVKMPDTTRKISFENINSVGSFGLLSTYNAIGGKIGKLTYYAYYHKRVSDGYRNNSNSDAQSQFISLNYAFSKKLNLKGELGRSTYLFQIPGPLTDSMFKADPKQSTRKRNYYSPDIYIPSVTLDWSLNSSTKINWTTSAVMGSRSSVQFVGFANDPDIIDPNTNTYSNRQVDIDNYNSYTSEVRIRKDYNIKSINNTVVAGVRYINNDMRRRQQGKGTTGTDYDLALTEPGFGRDLRYKTHNIGAFVENLIQVNKRLSFSPGIRIESGESNMAGKITYLVEEEIPIKVRHRFALLGISGQYKIKGDNLIYFGWSQAYRPIVLADIIPASTINRTDKNLKDSKGYNAEIGIRGVLNKLHYDFGIFRLAYNNRIGSLIIDNPGQDIILKTNTGNSITNGVELYAEYTLTESQSVKTSVFTSTSFFSAYYIDSKITNGSENVDITGNKLETVPQWISRNGLQFSIRRFSSVLLYSYVDKSFSDASNTVAPSDNGAKGLVPAYGLLDLNISYRFNSQFAVKAGINNITNEKYFTKRPAGYPGAGVWTSDGRGVNVSVQMKL